MTLFIHITDLHFRENDHVDKLKIESLTSSIVKHNPDTVIFLFGGDLAQSGSYKEYESFEKFYNKLILNINSRIKCKVYTFFTPGNHDLKYLPNEKRTRNDILKLNQDDIAKQYNDEIKKIKYFEDFTNEVYQSQKDSTIEELKTEDNHFYRHFQIIIENEILTDIVCLNNALFSFYDIEDQFHDNDAGALKLPFDKLKYIKKNGNLGFLLMHFPFEFFEFNTKNKLQYKVDRYFDFVFTGHIHNDESNQRIHQNRKVLNLKTGVFNNSDNIDSTFTIICLENQNMHVYNYQWNIKNNFYEEQCMHQSQVNVKYIGVEGLSFNSDFIDNFYTDPINSRNSVLDCFIFPNIISTNIIDENEQEKISDLDSLIDVIHYHDKIIIEGDDGSGKTTLLKYIYNELSKEYLILYIDESSVIKNRSTKRIIQELFFNQYNAVSIDQFYHYDITKRILIVDNVEVNQKALKSISEEFAKTIMTSQKSNNKSVIAIIKENFDEDNGIILEIKGFYKIKRMELANKLYSKLYEKSGHKLNNKTKKKFEIKFNNIVDTHLTLFGVNPFMINLLVQHLFENQTSEEKNIYNDVFNSNLTRTIRNSADTYETRDYNSIVTALQKVSFYMHQNSLSIINEEDITKIISNYNEKFRQKVKCRVFVEVLLHAKVLKETDANNYCFASKNYFAYYVSKEFIYLMNKKDLSDPIFINLFDNIFNNVNDKILLFLAFSQQNDRIINYIAEKAINVFDGLKEIEIEKLKILQKTEKDIRNLKLIDDDDRKNHISSVEKSEERMIDKERNSVFDMFGKEYNDLEVKYSTFDNYIKLLSTILPNFTHMLEKNDQEKIARLIYKLPNQFLYWMMRDIEENIDEIYDLLKKAVLKSGKANSDDVDKIAHEIVTMFAQIISYSIVSLYNDVSKISMDYSTEELLVDNDWETNITMRVQKMLFSAHSTTDTEHAKFKNSAIKEYEKAIKEKNKVMTNIIQIAVSSFIISNDLFTDFHGINQKFLTTFYGEDAMDKYLDLKKSTI